MLSRVADALFWMSRYLERAEHLARLLDVHFHTELELRGVLGGAAAVQTQALLAIAQAAPPPQIAAVPANLHAWLGSGSDNPNSILACVNRARNNARGIRGSISSTMWRE